MLLARFLQANLRPLFRGVLIRAHGTHFGATGSCVVRMLLVMHSSVMVVREAIRVLMVLSLILIVPIVLLRLICIMGWLLILMFSFRAHAIRRGRAHVDVVALAAEDRVVDL